MTNTTKASATARVAVPFRAANWDSDHALVELALQLAEENYQFTSITPSSHAIVNARVGNDLAHDLQGVFGWNRPFDPDLIPPEMLRLGLLAGIFEIDWRVARSLVRFSTVGDALVVHSAYPTISRDSVFLGPDTYRFVNLLSRALSGGDSLIELGCGTGAAALVLAHRYARVVLTDINAEAIRFARVNAEINTPLLFEAELELLEGDLFAGAEGSFDAIVANPPFMVDAEHRLYRNGGPRGFDLPLRILRESLVRLSPRGRLVLYTGVPYVGGRSPFLEEARRVLAGRTYAYEELDVDVFGDELAHGDYARIDRLAVGALIVAGATR